MKKILPDLPPFDDFLGLSSKIFFDYQLLVFHGMSGSGKSSCLNFLAHHHPVFKNQLTHWIWTQHRRFNPDTVRGQGLVVVDEIVSPLQIPAVRSLLRTNQKVAIASHLHPLWFKLFCPSIPQQSFCTDSSTDKLSTYLDRLGVSHTQSALQFFSKRYGSNYVDLHCILECAPKKSLDYALQFSQKFNKISVQKKKNWSPSLPRLNFD